MLLLSHCVQKSIMLCKVEETGPHRDRRPTIKSEWTPPGPILISRQRVCSAGTNSRHPLPTLFPWVVFAICVSSAFAANRFLWHPCRDAWILYLFFSGGPVWREWSFFNRHACVTARSKTNSKTEWLNVIIVCFVSSGHPHYPPSSMLGRWIS